MAVPYPQRDITRDLSGGADAWDEGVAGQILSSDFFASASPTQTNLKVWNGSAWVLKPLKHWNGTAWVSAVLKRWNGSSWVTV